MSHPPVNTLNFRKLQLPDYCFSTIDQYVGFDVTADVAAYAAGTLDNNGWWIGTSAYWPTSGLYQVGGAYAGWVLMPSLVVEYIPEPMTLTLLGLGTLVTLRRRR